MFQGILGFLLLARFLMGLITLSKVGIFTVVVLYMFISQLAQLLSVTFKANTG